MVFAAVPPLLAWLPNLRLHGLSAATVLESQTSCKVPWSVSVHPPTHYYVPWGRGWSWGDSAKDRAAPCSVAGDPTEFWWSCQVTKGLRAELECEREQKGHYGKAPRQI